MERRHAESERRKLDQKVMIGQGATRQPASHAGVREWSRDARFGTVAIAAKF